MCNMLPIQCYLELTSSCNLRCTHCFASAGNDKISFITFEDAIRVVKAACDMGVFWLNISGGEPLLHPNIFEIIKYTTTVPLVTSLLTNGILWDDNIISKLLEVDPNRKTKIQISLDGTNATEFGCHRNVSEKDVEKIVSTIGKLRHLGFVVTCLHVASPNTVSHTIKTLYFALDELLVDAFQIVPFFPTGRGSVFIDKINDFWQQWNKLVVDLTMIKKNRKEKKLKNNFKIGVFTPYELALPLDYADMHDEILNTWEIDFDDYAMFKKISRRTVYCEAARTELTVSADFKLYPCVASLRTKYCGGDLKGKNIQEIFNSSDVFIWFRSIHETISKMEPCNMCRYVKVCAGGCRLASNAILNTSLLPDPRCPIVYKYMVSRGLLC